MESSKKGGEDDDKDSKGKTLYKPNYEEGS